MTQKWRKDMMIVYDDCDHLRIDNVKAVLTEMLMFIFRR